MFLSSAHGVHPREIAPADSPLPRGPGLSSEYYGDVGIGNNSAVIFADNFEAGDYLAKWDDGIRRNLLSLVDESAIDPVLGNKSIRAAAGNGAEGGAGLIEWFPSADTVVVRFYGKFDEQSRDFSHLSRLAANRADNKWSSFGTAGTIPNGENYFVTAIEPTGVNTLGDWKTYTYWPDMPGQYGHVFPQAIDPPVVEKDQWLSVELMVKHNTPGVADGEQAFWIDGELIGHWEKIKWRTSPTLWANAFVLETYLQDALVTPNNTALFDNVVIASEYIGPSGLTIPGIPGDFDADEDVDGADFLGWQRDMNVGSFSDWEANFGTTPLGIAAAATVPEPSGAAMIFFATAFGGVAIRWRNRR